jgi:hypothetical protein
MAYREVYVVLVHDGRPRAPRRPIKSPPPVGPPVQPEARPDRPALPSRRDLGPLRPPLNPARAAPPGLLSFALLLGLVGVKGHPN